jgi:hypothetical protein
MDTSKLIYRGRAIQRVNYQGTVCYRVPGSSDLAANLKTAKKWIDAELAGKEVQL